jgi:hypothetical protein
LNLLALYPDAKPADPDKLSRKLHRIEAAARAIALAWCNGTGPMGNDEAARESAIDAVLAQAVKVLGVGPEIRFNGDARGYALKIDAADLAAGVKLYRDMGGNGIICPEFTGDR